MLEKSGRQPDVYVIGLGIKGIEHLTRETEEACRRSTEILTVATHPAVLTHLGTLCPKVTDLHPITYREDEHRMQAYYSMAAMTLAAGLEHPPVTFATYGHPQIYVCPTKLIRAAAPYLGLEVEVQPGISALDTMFIDLDVDPAMDGLQMFEATDVLIKQRPLQNDVPCLLWQVGAVETALYSTAVSSRQRFHRIRDYLLRFYPADHEVTAVYSTNHPLMNSTSVTFELGEMDAQNERLHQGLTLYIPPVAERSIADTELMTAIASPKHLESLVQHP